MPAVPARAVVTERLARAKRVIEELDLAHVHLDRAEPELVNALSGDARAKVVAVVFRHAAMEVLAVAGAVFFFLFSVHLEDPGLRELEVGDQEDQNAEKLHDCSSACVDGSRRMFEWEKNCLLFGFVGCCSDMRGVELKKKQMLEVKPT